MNLTAILVAVFVDRSHVRDILPILSLDKKLRMIMNQECQA